MAILSGICAKNRFFYVNHLSDSVESITRKNFYEELNK